jgi:hypothetical protein
VLAMIFVPSIGGISHNPCEHTPEADLVAGANVLFDTLRVTDIFIGLPCLSQRTRFTESRRRGGEPMRFSYLT